jgi:Tol biopolymer transport system component
MTSRRNEMTKLNSKRKSWLIFGLLVMISITAQPSLSAADKAPLGEIAFVSDRDGNNEIYLMNTDGSNQRNLTRNVANDYSPVWSPDGTRIAFTSTRDGNNEIYVMDIDGKNLHNLTNNSANDLLLGWSPDGKFLSYQSDGSVADGNGLYVMTSDGNNSRQVATIHYGIAYPLSWSPNSKDILFFSEQYGVGANRQQAWETVFVDTEHATSVVSDFYARNLFWSPDGKLIMFGDCGILLLKTLNDEPDLLDSNYQFKVSDDNFMCIVPYGWSPDGKQILFSAYFRGYNEANQAGLYMMNADGTQVHQLTHEDIAYDAKWSPDGQQIVYVSERQIYVVEIGTNIITSLTDAPGHNEYPVWRPQPVSESP